ncbi:NADPH-dependent F420 reductase [Streptomyces atratus]|uniref:NADPH-dependent F420 reductase n=1 Tax=Streptomyces atratus TaxID=1893 RepID=UPI002252656C|nr:NAD(P)-binding domain-containing protein [Streptomyces atratus]MCX5339113.1 NAD(P)-binding domain-containing protein [Streptomyces atratus]
MRMGLLGSGNVAQALATAWATAGHDVVMGSRRPKDRTAPGIPVTGPREAAEHGEVLVNATPGTVPPEILATIGASTPAGKPLIDVGIGLTDDMGLAHLESCLAEQIQELLPRTPVVKTLCTMTASVMTDPGGLDGPSTVFLSGDDAEAKRTVGRLLDDLGRPASSRMDLGGIATARGQGHFALLFLGVAGALGTDVFNIKVVPLSTR